MDVIMYTRMCIYTDSFIYCRIKRRASEQHSKRVTGFKVRLM